MGVVLAMQDQLDEAITHFAEALRIKPDFADARESLKKTLFLRESKDKK